MEFSRRDVEFSRRDITFTRRDVIWSLTLPRRDVAPNVATSFGHVLCHVATWDSNVVTWIEPTLCHVATSPRTSRRGLVKLSVTSRRHPARRDVTLFLAQERFSFGLSSHTPALIGTLALLHTIAHRTCRSSYPTGRRPSIAHRPSEFIFEPSSAPGTGLLR